MGLLNPKDDTNKYNNSDYTCLKVNLHIDQCYIVDEIKLLLRPKEPNLIELKDYIYGTFENPRVVFNTSILPEQVSILNDYIDEPILFDNSRDLFYQIKCNEIMSEISYADAFLALSDFIDFKKRKDLEHNNNSI